MTAPSLPVTTSTPTRGPERAPAAPVASGYLATSVGGLLGLLVLGGVGIGIGLGLADLYYDPDAGLANLGLLLFPLGLGGVGVLAGLFFGVRTALRRRGHDKASRTAWLTLALAVVVLTLGVATSGLGVPFVLVAPLGGRWLVQQGA